MRTFVLDANAVVDDIQKGPGSAKLESLLVDAFRLQRPLLVSVWNWGEVFY